METNCGAGYVPRLTIPYRTGTLSGSNQKSRVTIFSLPCLAFTGKLIRLRKAHKIVTENDIEVPCLQHSIYEPGILPA